MPFSMSPESSPSPPKGTSPSKTLDTELKDLRAAWLANRTANATAASKVGSAELVGASIFQIYDEQLANALQRLEALEEQLNMAKAFRKIGALEASLQAQKKPRGWGLW